MLAALNVLGWLVAVPLLLVALVDPFVDYGDWPDRLIGDRRGDVQLRTPDAKPRQDVKPETAKSNSSAAAEDDPLQAARDALAQSTAAGRRRGHRPRHRRHGWVGRRVRWHRFAR